MNISMFTGRATKDIELRYSQSGNAVALFTLAVPRRKREDGAVFISCKAFGKTAELVSKHVHRGDLIAVVGHEDSGSYEKDGHKVYTRDTIIDNVEFLEPKPRSDAAERPENIQQEQTKLQSTDDNDLPF